MEKKKHVLPPEDPNLIMYEGDLTKFSYADFADAIIAFTDRAGELISKVFNLNKPQ